MPEPKGFIVRHAVIAINPGGPQHFAANRSKGIPIPLGTIDPHHGHGGLRLIVTPYDFDGYHLSLELQQVVTGDGIQGTDPATGERVLVRYTLQFHTETERDRWLGEVGNMEIEAAADVARERFYMQHYGHLPWSQERHAHDLAIRQAAVTPIDSKSDLYDPDNLRVLYTPVRQPAPTPAGG